MNQSFGELISNKVTSLNETIKRWSFNQKILALLLLSLIIYGSFISLDVFLLRGWIDTTFGPTPDLGYYQERAQAILDGLILYKDIDVESPPLINYLFVPPQFFGGESWMFEIWFSLFPLFTGLLMYLILRRWNEHEAFLASCLAIICPYAVVDATWGIQDEPIVAFFYILPVLIFLAGRIRTSALVGTIATWVKMLQGLIFPNLLISMKSNKERIIAILIGIVFSLCIIGPFVIASGESITDLFRYYFLGGDASGNTSGGMSLINLLVKGGFDIPGSVGLAITVIALIASYYLAYRWKLDIWRSAMLTTVIFLSIYPMIRLGYFIIPFTFFALWAVKYKGVLFRLIAMYGFLFIGQGIETDEVGALTFDNNWIIAFILVLIGLLIMLDTARICIKNKCLLDEEPEDS